MRYLPAALAALLLLGPGCSRRDGEAPAPRPSPAQADPGSRADALRDRLASFERRDYTWRQGDAAGPFSAYFEEGALRHIREELTFGERGASVAEYFFDDGALFYYRERGERRLTAPESPRAGETDRIIWTLTFGTDDSLRSAEKTVNGTPAELETGKVESVLEHARALRAVIASSAEGEAPAS